MGRTAERTELVEREHASGKHSRRCSIRSTLESRSESGDSFQVVIRWKTTPRRASRHRNASRHFPQVGGGSADGPAGEGLAEVGWAGGGRLDDEGLVVQPDQARTASRPSRVQARPFSLYQWIRSRTVSSSACASFTIHRYPAPASQGQQHDRAPEPHRTGAAQAHDLRQLLPLLVSQPAHTDRLFPVKALDGLGHAGRALSGGCRDAAGRTGDVRARCPHSRQSRVSWTRSRPRPGGGAHRTGPSPPDGMHVGSRCGAGSGGQVVVDIEAVPVLAHSDRLSCLSARARR